MYTRPKDKYTVCPPVVILNSLKCEKAVHFEASVNYNCKSESLLLHSPTAHLAKCKHRPKAPYNY